jgi:raffinose/stachyose/melibiose transport system permease protein
MVPSVIVAKSLHIVNTTYGLVIMYWGFMLPMAIFLYQGFIKSVPRELEEAAMIDGCGQIYAFFKIVFPMLMPITSTIAIINVLGVFNDFLLPLIMLSSDDVKTIPLSLSIFFSNYTAEWNLIMAALALSIIPGLVFFLLMQKKIIGGLAEGAIKG